AIMFFLHILILYHLLEEVIFTLYYLYTTTKIPESRFLRCADFSGGIKKNLGNPLGFLWKREEES
ncbi:hypothetical protein ACTNEY_16010, partial [Fusicatenibacter saccharivorans]